MSIWFDKSITKSTISSRASGTMAEYLDIKCTELGPDIIKMSMPVNEKTKQPYGLLHGGASCVLAETIGSVASAFVVDQQKYKCVGIEINANHIRGVKEGLVTANCTPLHIGRSTHVWDIKIYDEQERMICISRLTVAIIEKD